MSRNISTIYTPNSNTGHHFSVGIARWSNTVGKIFRIISQSYRFNTMVHSLFVYFFIILITCFDCLITYVALASLFGRLGFDAHGGTTVIFWSMQVCNNPCEYFLLWASGLGTATVTQLICVYESESLGGEIILTTGVFFWLLLLVQMSWEYSFNTSYLGTIS